MKNAILPLDGIEETADCDIHGSAFITFGGKWMMCPDCAATHIQQLREALWIADQIINNMAYIVNDGDIDNEERDERLITEWKKYPIVDIGTLLDNAIHAGFVPAARALEAAK